MKKLTSEKAETVQTEPKFVFGIPVPKWKNDIVHRLRHVDGAPACVRMIEFNVESVRQVMSDSLFEIEKLRKENRSLKRQLRILQRSTIEL